MIAGHTPGEWVLGADGDTVETPGKTILADCSLNELPAAECRANAALMRAAPALVDACEDALGVIPCETDYQREVADALRAALTRAEGG